MPSCCAYGCTNRSSMKLSGITFHRLPKKENLREAWIKAIRRDQWNPQGVVHICSAHFPPEDFDRTSINCVRLKENVVPSVFPAFPSYFQKVTKTRKPPAKRVKPTTEVSALVDEPAISTPRKIELKRKIKELQGKTKRMRNSRLKKRNAAIENILQEIKKQRFLAEEDIQVLSSISKNKADTLLKNIRGITNSSKCRAYSKELRAFALTLHFYSPRAYNFVRKSFDTCLPHERTLRKWYQSVSGAPGFTQDALESLKRKVESATKSGHHVICTLIMDEMAIRKHTEWDGEKYHGYVDFGNSAEDDNMPIAKDALVFMLACINGSWKLPVGYFLVTSVTAEQRANLVKQCLTLVHETGAVVVALTCDGASSNIAMAKMLGCSFKNLNNLKTAFPHPVVNQSVCVFFDPAHMLKLIRNTLAEKGPLSLENGKQISWKYIERLHMLQQKEGIHLGNKLNSANMQWQKQKIKVKLAAQVLSDSISDAIEICQLENIPGFEESHETIEFIRHINQTFDILNSRSMMQKNWKQPIHRGNFNRVQEYLLKVKTYLASLLLASDQTPVMSSGRKTGFLGFCVCINSLLQLFHQTVMANYGPHLSYLPLYKISQDHLELFFGSICSMGACNNNPTARQFSSAYKRLLIHGELVAIFSGNCSLLDEVPILQVSSAIPSTSEKIINASCERTPLTTDVDKESDLCCVQHLQILDDHDYIHDPLVLSTFSKYIVTYIAGFVVCRLAKILKCETCIDVLLANNYTEAMYALIRQQTKEGLKFPSPEVVSICQASERVFRSAIEKSGGQRISRKYDLLFLTTKVLHQYSDKEMFPGLGQHVLNHSPLQNHAIQLVKCIAERYLSVRFHYAGKRFTEAMHSTKVRHTYTKPENCSLLNEVPILQVSSAIPSTSKKIINASCERTPLTTDVDKESELCCAQHLQILHDHDYIHDPRVLTSSPCQNMDIL